jgi:predicted enzyme related to lactoylglutathione lyase
MTNTANNLRVDYVEFPALDTGKIKAVYGQVFGWKFEDYGPNYTSFQDGRLSGGFTKDARVGSGGPLVVIYASDLAGVEAKIKSAGGSIAKETFSFPGGRRFHFSDPSGNVLAVWSEA